VACIEIFPCNYKFIVRANYGYDTDCIIETATIEDAKKALLAITTCLSTKANLLFVETIRKVVAANDEPSNDELKALFRYRSKK
jgi:hypothetical protein